MCKTLNAINKKVGAMEKDIENVKQDIQLLQVDITAINTKIDIVVRFFTGWRMWVIFLIFIASVALAGQRLIELIIKIPMQ